MTTSGANWSVLNSWPAIEQLLRNSSKAFPLSRLNLTLADHWPQDELRSFLNNSLVVEVHGEPVAVLLSMSQKESDLKFIDRPVFIELSAHSSIDLSTFALLGEGLKSTLSRTGSLSGSLELMNQPGVSNQIETLLLDKMAIPSLVYRGFVDLETAEEEILSEMRPSHRRHIRKSRDFLTEVVVSFGALQKAVFEEFRSLYLYEAKQTYSENRWEGMHKAILQEEAFLVSSYLDGDLVGATYCWVSPEMASYGSGAYARRLFSEAPIAHYAMFKSITFAKEIGLESFLLGEVYAPYGSKKQKNIAFFKRGFANRVLTSTRFDFSV